MWHPQNQRQGDVGGFDTVISEETYRKQSRHQHSMSCPMSGIRSLRNTGLRMPLRFCSR